MSGYTVPQGVADEIDDALDGLFVDNAAGVASSTDRPRIHALVQAVADAAYLAGRKAAMRGEPAGPVGVAYDATREDET